MPETFADRDLRGARFDRCDLSGVVMRGVLLEGADLDAPWLLGEGSTLLVNGVDVVPYVRAELARRFPGHASRLASDPDGLREAYEVVQQAWQRALDRAAALPDGTVDVSVDGEWSYAQTLRHLVMATDVWLRGAVLGVEQPYHPLGVPYEEFEADGHDTSVFALGTPPFEEVRAARADRVAMVRAFLAGATEADLAMPVRHPWAPEREVSTLHCLRTILDEEWSHLRFALRDLDALQAPTPERRAPASD